MDVESWIRNFGATEAADWSDTSLFSTINFAKSQKYLTLVLLNPDIPCFANRVDPDQLASEQAN